MKTILAGMAMLVAVSAGWADVRVEIVDHPARVLQWSPVLITAQIVNDGPDTAIVAVGRWMTDGYFVETGPADGELAKRSPFAGLRASHGVRKLQPGGTWLFQIDVRERMTERGHYRARVGVHGGGRCSLTQAVAEELGATPIVQKRKLRKRKGPEPYECWEGLAFSQEVAVQVDEPTSAIDREALKYILSPDYPVPIGGLETLDYFRLIHGSRYLKERFPNSHYTYVSVFYGSHDFDWLLRVQPHHPLTPYTRMKAVLNRSQVTDWCSESAAAHASELQLRQSLEQYALQMVREMRASQ